MNQNPLLNNNPDPKGKNLDSATPKKNTSFNSPTFKVNLLSSKPIAKPQKKFKFVYKFLLLITFLSVIFVVTRAVNLSQKIFVGKKLNFFQTIKQFLGLSTTTLIGEDLHQINILLLGVGGEGHDGPYLSDTMILAQIRPDLGQASLSAIPRDYLVNLPENFGPQKINSAFAYGLGKDLNYEKGGLWARQVTETLTGLPVPYFAVIDFSGFEKAVDKIGGIDLVIEKSFTDVEYPNNNFGYLPPISFQAGQAHMDGKTALMFARSRHGNNDEGSDFARGRRQQKVISAFKQKVLSLNIIKDINSINNLLGVFANHFHTNLQPAEMLRLFSITKESNINQFLATSLSPETGLICDGRQEETGAYIVLPCLGKNENDIKNFFKNSFVYGRLSEEKAVVWLATSTGNKQDFKNAYDKLTELGLSVWELPYSKDMLEKNIVYSLTQKPATLEYVKNSLFALEVFTPPPGVKADKNKVDLIVILGQN